MSAKHYLPEGLPFSGGPSEDGLDTPFWDGLREERLVLQRCNNCQEWQWGPEWLCHQCLSFDMGWEACPAEGTIYSWQRVWHPAHAVLKDQGPYIVALVELPQAGNLRVIGNLLGDPQQAVEIGSAVCAHFEHHNTVAEPYTLLQWQLA